jgi:hypothetical protein
MDTVTRRYKNCTMFNAKQCKKTVRAHDAILVHETNLLTSQPFQSRHGQE